MNEYLSLYQTSTFYGFLTDFRRFQPSQHGLSQWLHLGVGRGSFSKIWNSRLEFHPGLGCSRRLPGTSHFLFTLLGPMTLGIFLGISLDTLICNNRVCMFIDFIDYQLNICISLYLLVQLVLQRNEWKRCRKK